MRISELVEELNQIREQRGDLLVSAYQRENSFDDETYKVYDIEGETLDKESKVLFFF